ncbi:unnamed protein product [Cylicocyclus nassatus]|uniref:Uncharacterized protein n=1 Tax=Cylicocyclus nassatus TaxID=53992 RepID=A0AA36DPP0_CYLNA|nr:unnamed protein product [Cylicocyclus nassatus]
MINAISNKETSRSCKAWTQKEVLRYGNTRNRAIDHSAKSRNNGQVAQGGFLKYITRQRNRDSPATTLIHVVSTYSTMGWYRMAMRGTDETQDPTRTRSPEVGATARWAAEGGFGIGTRR